MEQIKIKNVSKRFGKIQALDSISLTLEAGKIYGLLGRNGAGKTTLLNVITNRIFADSGEVLLNGHPVSASDEAGGNIYMMSETNYYPNYLKIADVFKWTKEFYKRFDMDYAMHLCQLFELNEKKKVRELSTGYGSIYKMITALSLDVPFILLDEPVLGLDANHRELFYKTLLANYSENPRTFVLSTHLIEEVAGVIEDVIIIQKGHIIKNEPCEELLKAGYTATGSISAVHRFTEGKDVISADVLGGLKSAHILGKPDKSNVPDGVEITKLDLQKLFIQLTNG